MLHNRLGSQGLGARRGGLAWRNGAPKAACKTSAANAQAPSAPPTTIVRINPELVAQGGVDPTHESPENRAAFAAMLRNAFLPIDLGHPGLRILNIDPPVISIDSFLPAATCDALIAAAQNSGRMAQSKVGGNPTAASSAAAGAARAAQNPQADDIRTSSTLAITRDVLSACPELDKPLEELLGAAAVLLAPALEAAGQQGLRQALFSKPNVLGQIAPELPQVAHYLPGQHFLEHEDAFPPAAALSKGYQRRATLLVYLNDVATGGCTTFSHLGLSVQPVKGRALLFFPAFSGGMPDSRTLHIAEDAVDEKWVSQTWLCTALPKKGGSGGGGAAGKQAGKPGSKKRGFR